MGKLALAAKITHVPSMYLSELPGKNHGCRQGAIDGHKEISKRCREMGVDTIIVRYPLAGQQCLSHQLCRPF